MFYFYKKIIGNKEKAELEKSELLMNYITQKKRKYKKQPINKINQNALTERKKTKSN